MRRQIHCCPILSTKHFIESLNCYTGSLSCFIRSLFLNYRGSRLCMFTNSNGEPTNANVFFFFIYFWVADSIKEFKSLLIKANGNLKKKYVKNKLKSAWFILSDRKKLKMKRSKMVWCIHFWCWYTISADLKNFLKKGGGIFPVILLCKFYKFEFLTLPSHALYIPAWYRHVARKRGERGKGLAPPIC